MEASDTPGPHQACERAFGLPRHHDLSSALLTLVQDFSSDVKATSPGAHVGYLAWPGQGCWVPGVHLEKYPLV